MNECYSATPQFPLNQQQLIQSILNDMVYVKGGTFDMGQNPNAQITLTSYHMDRYAVPYYQFRSYQQLIGQQYQADSTADGTLYPINVNFQDAASFCQWLGQKTGLPFSLPTEAQWEYAARNRGQNVQYSTDDGTLKPGINFPSIASYVQHINGYSISLPIKVNAFPPNPAGFYLMNGNGLEWTRDWYGPLPNTPETNPTGPATGTQKVVRGTDPDDVQQALDPSNTTEETKQNEQYLSVYNRSYGPIDPDADSLFRCVINSDKPLPKQ
jgi:formylglycine-generating enzyme required for sulfatase activity